MKKKLRIIEFYPGYFAASDGHVYSALGRNGRDFRQVKEFKGNGRYLMVYLALGEKGARRGKSKPVHRLIAEVFHGMPHDRKLMVRHLNGNPIDNRPDNLAWGTAKENAHDRYAHGTMLFGEDCPTAKLTKKQVKKMREYYAAGFRVREIARIFPMVNFTTVGTICHGKTWRKCKTFTRSTNQSPGSRMRGRTRNSHALHPIPHPTHVPGCSAMQLQLYARAV